VRRIGRARADHDAGHLGDRRQRLAAESERADGVEILGDPELARGMGGHRQRQILRLHPAAVVHDAHQPHAPLLERHRDPRRAGIESVLEQFLDDARRSLDHLAGGDAVDDRRRQGADASHGVAGGRRPRAGRHDS
jgi:hypothetical protein